MNSFFDAIRRTGFRRAPGRLAAGICSGIAQSAQVDVFVVRLFTLLAFLLPGIGITAYVIVWILTPWQDGSIPLQRWLEQR